MEMGYLFLESEDEKKHLLDPNMNHIGIGVDWDSEKIIIVMAISYKSLAITRISEKEDLIEVRGKMLDSNSGLFAVVVKSEDPNLSNKDYKIGPEKIDFNRPTREFIATIPIDHKV